MRTITSTSFIAAVLLSAIAGCSTKNPSTPCEPACAGDTAQCDLATGDCVPCLLDEHCPAATPRCESPADGDGETFRCVACLRAEDCGGETPLCDAGRCVACTSNDDCGGETPECDPTSSTCVACTANRDCGGETPICDAGACVECASSDDCDGAASECDLARNTCVECLGDDDCTALDAAECIAGACSGCTSADACPSEAPNCDGGTCVECTVATEVADCGVFSCDPATNACTGTERGSVLDCVECVADSECGGADSRCVALGGQGYCLRDASTTCIAPLRTPLLDRTSLSGASAANYCGPSPDASCPAVRAMLDETTCSGDGECGTSGLCRNLVGAGLSCTVACSTAGDCPPSGAPAGCSAANHCGTPAE